MCLVHNTAIYQRQSVRPSLLGCEMPQDKDSEFASFPASVLSLLVSLTARPPLNSAAGAAEESARLSVLGNTLIASRRAVSGSLIVQDGGAVPSLDFFLWSERMFVSYETKTM